MAPFLYFFDQTAENPVAPATVVAIYPANLPICPETKIIQGMLGPGGVFDTQGLLVPSTTYMATFYGSEAPALPQSFTTVAGSGSDTTITVAQYRSPYFSADGYRDDIIAKQPKGWYNPGDPGLLFLATALGAALGKVATKAQQLRAYQRLQGCVGGAIDSWVRDYLGGFITRYPGESDTAFKARAAFILSGLRLTLQAITVAVQAYYTPVGQTFSVTPLFTDFSGALDIAGFLDVTSMPNITVTTYVYDRMSDPARAAMFGISEPEFAIDVTYTIGQSELGWMDYNYMDFDDFMFGDANGINYSTTPYDPNLGALVSFIKAEGTIPVYGVLLNITNS